MNALIIDDEKKFASILKRNLKKYGFDSSIVSTGAAARKEMETGDFKLVLLDVNLPDGNGYQLCQEFRAQNNRLLIIILTSSYSLEDKLTGFQSGTDDYLVKPFEFKELLARIRGGLRRNYQLLEPIISVSEQLKIADLVMDLHSKTVTRAGQFLHLTPREFFLLEYFLRNQGAVLSPHEIIQFVWGETSELHSNVLNVYINSLRNKVDKVFGTKLIHTRIGLGYIMKESSTL
ncbi:MAG: response regulator transcription factor [Siphonobacter sp.]